MSRLHPPQRIIAIAPSTRGFGFAVLEGEARLVDWGVKSAKGDKNIHSLEKVEALILQYQPAVMALEDASPDNSWRSARIQALNRELIALAGRRDLRVKVYPRERVRQALLSDGAGTKQDIAEALAKRFAAELGARLPPKRKAWKSESYQMGIFDAVALAVTAYARPWSSLRWSG